jgi:hypothetical protein
VKAVAISRVAAPASADRPGAPSASDIVGRVACHDVRDAGGKVAIAKGETLTAESAARLLRLPWDEVHLFELEPGDVHEEPAGARLCAAAAGPGVEARGYTGGQWTLAAARRGLVDVRHDALRVVNALHGMSVFTLWDQQPVDEGEAVAKAKITPLAIAGTVLAEAEALAARAAGLVAVRPFACRVIGALAPRRLEAGQRQRFEASLAEKIAWFGSRLLALRYPGDTATSVAESLEALLGDGAELLVAAGAGSLDPLDPIFTGLERLGGRMERHGAPAHPGSLLWLAELRGRPVLGMPTCGMFSQATVFDLVLPRLLAGDRLGNLELAALGHGGLLSRDSAWRFPPYRKSAARGELGDAQP